MQIRRCRLWSDGPCVLSRLHSFISLSDDVDSIFSPIHPDLSGGRYLLQGFRHHDLQTSVAKIYFDLPEGI
jgi:hypothetical protein